jgi:S-formylglutathione hydrolase FrmB
VRRVLSTATCLALLALAAPAEAARIVTFTTPSHQVDLSELDLGGTPLKPSALRVNVYLPDGYDGGGRFPVLYLLHGHGDGYHTWSEQNRGDLLQTAKGFPGIIVMPEGWRGWYTNWWNDGARGEPAWERFHLDELVPFLERRLRIRPGRRWHAIAGLSMGGEGAIFYASQRPGYFGSAASFSGPLSIQRPEWPAGFDTQGEESENVFGDPSEQRFYWTGHNPSALTANLRATRLYVTVGDGVPGSPQEATNTLGILAELELRQHAQDFNQAARNAGLELTYRPRQGIHDWPYWRQHLKDAIAWGFFATVPESPKHWTYRTVATSGEAWCLRFKFEHPPSTLETFRLDGRRLSATGSGTVRITTLGGAVFTAQLPFQRQLATDPCARSH